MSPKQPSKQRRQAQNRQQRAALQARRDNASAPTPSSPAKSTSTAGSGEPAGGGSLISRLRGASAAGREVRTGGTQPPGQRAALSGLLAAFAGLIVGSLLFKVPMDRAGEPIASKESLVAEWTLSALDEATASPEADAAEVAESVDDWLPGGSEPYAQAYWPVSLAVVLPLVGAGLTFRAVSRRSPAKLVNRAMYVALFGALLTGQLLLVFIPALVSLGVAAYQVRKAEVRALAEAGPPPAGAEPPDDVIEADVVEAEVADEAEVVEADVVDDDDAADPRT